MSAARTLEEARVNTTPFFKDKFSGEPCEREGNVLCHNPDWRNHRHVRILPSDVLVGCCSDCAGTGADYGTGCGSCYGTGHCHPEDPTCRGRYLRDAGGER